MTEPLAPPLTIVRPGEGGEGYLGSIGVAFKLWGADTNGSVSVVEHPFPVGALVPPHLHTREDEYSIVTEGEIGFRSGDREVVLGAGGYITKPRGELHTMWNAGPVPARMIEIISPAGFEHCFRELAEMLADGPPPTEDAIPELAAKYGLQFGQPDWLPDVIARYGLTSPSGARSSQ
ncbi:cupin domain-containing protein [Streptacidiphilus sp. EB103A]|uniref:cupin domain-containing protein n=1 Tax=Streptacidiphilus sp. EB103A TaxID=3156275 RepID=UPI00351232A5